MTASQTKIRTQYSLLTALVILGAGICALGVHFVLNQEVNTFVLSQKQRITPSVSAVASHGAEINPTSSASSGAQPVIITDRIRLISPVPDQKMDDDNGTITFKGQMKDFFEGTLNIRLLNERGEKILSDSIQAQNDNYGQFADFQKDVNYVHIPDNAGTHGTWELYETSPKDGTENVLLSIPVQFSR